MTYAETMLMYMCEGLTWEEAHETVMHLMELMIGRRNVRSNHPRSALRTAPNCVELPMNKALDVARGLMDTPLEAVA